MKKNVKKIIINVILAILFVIWELLTIYVYFRWNQPPMAITIFTIIMIIIIVFMAVLTHVAVNLFLKAQEQNKKQ